MAQRTLRVEGMNCDHCEESVEVEVERVHGVTSATANHETEMLEIETHEDVADGDVADAVREAGYEPVL